MFEDAMLRSCVGQQDLWQRSRQDGRRMACVSTTESPRTRQVCRELESSSSSATVDARLAAHARGWWENPAVATWAKSPSAGAPVACVSQASDRREVSLSASLGQAD